MTKYPLYTALSQLYELYGIELDEDTFETYAMSAWNKIGNKDYKIRIMKAHPICDPKGGWYVCKPCDMANGNGSIEAITLNFESAAETSAVENFPGLYNHDIEQWIEANKTIPNELYIPGKFVKYKELGDRIYFTEPYPEVNILYKEWYLDDDGLPYVNDKELNAIVAYCAYAHDFKHARMTKDANMMQIAQLEQAEWKRLCSEARTPVEMSQNSVNEVLDALTSWDTHHYGVSSTKPIR